MPISGTARSDEASVARHYDALDRFYREIWGEHVHHGLWTTGHESVEEATRALVEVVARWACARPGAVVADAGCGYGGTARILAREHGCEVVGFTLSAAQADWARRRGGGPRAARRAHRGPLRPRAQDLVDRRGPTRPAPARRRGRPALSAVLRESRPGLRPVARAHPVGPAHRRHATGAAGGRASLALRH